MFLRKPKAHKQNGWLAPAGLDDILAEINAQYSEDTRALSREESKSTGEHKAPPVNQAPRLTK